LISGISITPTLDKHESPKLLVINVLFQKPRSFQHLAKKIYK